MKLIAVSQRPLSQESHGLRLDTLDQRWAPFLIGCGLIAQPVPNHLDLVRPLMETNDPAGVLLTGGGDLASFNGRDTDRDEVERLLIDWALARQRPVVGVCRGMQVIQERFGVALQPVDGHVGRDHAVTIGGSCRSVNSYHRFGTRKTVPALAVLAVADDGVIEAVRHVSAPVSGIMWHPERFKPFSAADIRLFSNLFAVEGVS